MQIIRGGNRRDNLTRLEIHLKAPPIAPSVNLNKHPNLPIDRVNMPNTNGIGLPTHLQPITINGTLSSYPPPTSMPAKPPAWAISPTNTTTHPTLVEGTTIPPPIR
jgi:hypothetical protein